MESTLILFLQIMHQFRVKTIADDYRRKFNEITQILYHFNCQNSTYGCYYHLITTKIFII